MKFKTQALPKDLSTLVSECLILPVYKDKRFSKDARLLDDNLGGVLGAIRKRGDFAGKFKQLQMVPLHGAAKVQRVLLLGCGPVDEFDAQKYRTLLAQLATHMSSSQFKSAHILFADFAVDDYPLELQLQQISQAFVEKSYRYTRTRADKGEAGKLSSVTVLANGVKRGNQALKRGQAIGHGMNATKELGNLPGNICTPTYLAKQATRLARNESALTAKILNEKQMREMGMGSLLSVSAGSQEPAKLIVMDYRAAPKSQQPIVLVGKGITFDSGGISIKAGPAMDEMKFDMCGAATVFGVMEAVLQLQLPINLTGIVASAENMPSGTATKPGDIVTSMAGKTIEILNTDAEGRLVLCDALTYAERYKPKAVIDIATLTGACIVALGKHASGLFSNNDELAEQLLESGTASGDRAWRLPIWEDYQQQLKSNFADMANIGGPAAASITAACFLARFSKAYPWAHLDIAGTAWLNGADKGATGRPVAMLMQYLLSQTDK